MTTVTPPVVHPLPPSLEFLRNVNQLFIYQAFEVIEALSGYETRNKYVVMTPLLQQVFFMGEESDCCSRFFLGNQRSYRMHVLDNYGFEVMRFQRPFFCCFGDKVDVYCPIDTYAGRIQQECPMCKPTFGVMDAAGNKIFTIRAKCCVCKWCEVRFDVLTMDGQLVGSIHKEFGNLINEMLDYNIFVVSFPIDLDFKIKAIMLGAAILLDYLFFETA